MSCEKLSLLRDAFFASPFSMRAGQAASMNLRKFRSASAAGSVATTSKPCARNSAAQLAPITPVPTIAIFCTGLLKAIVLLPPDAVVFRATFVLFNWKEIGPGSLVGAFRKNQAGLALVE